MSLSRTQKMRVSVAMGPRGGVPSNATGWPGWVDGVLRKEESWQGRPGQETGDEKETRASVELGVRVASVRLRLPPVPVDEVMAK